MRPGLRTYLPVDKTLRAGRIDYKKLRKINPEAARRAVIEYLKTNGHHISQTAAVFGINRTVIYDIITKDKEGDLRDRSREYPNTSSKSLVDRKGHLPRWKI
jgi:hypothetical protein